MAIVTIRGQGDAHATTATTPLSGEDGHAATLNAGLFWVRVDRDRTLHVMATGGAPFIVVAPPNQPDGPYRVTLDPCNVPHVDVSERKRKRESADTAVGANPKAIKKAKTMTTTREAPHETPEEAAKRAARNARNRQRRAQKKAEAAAAVSALF